MLRGAVSRIATGVVLVTLAAALEAEAQSRVPAADARPWGPSLRVTDGRLADALEFLAYSSFTADRALNDLRRSRLPVTIGTPAQLASLAERDGGPTEEERTRLLAGTTIPHGARTAGAVAWVMFRSVRHDDEQRDGWVDQVWLAIEADSVDAWIRGAGGAAIEERIRHDYLAILAHEFVAHVGSIAGSRRMSALCDDPTPEQRARSARARARGEPEPEDGDRAACALRIENRVREELNGVLAVHGSRLLPMRQSYTMDSLHFEHARRRLYPMPAQRLRPLIPMRN